MYEKVRTREGESRELVVRSDTAEASENDADATADEDAHGAHDERRARVIAGGAFVGVALVLVVYFAHWHMQGQTSNLPASEFVDHVAAVEYARQNGIVSPPPPPEPEQGVDEGDYVFENQVKQAEKAADCKWVWTKGDFHWICYEGNHRHRDAWASDLGSELQPVDPPSQSVAQECRWIWTRRRGFRWVCWGGGRRHRDVPQSAAQQTSDAVTDLHETDLSSPIPANECKWLWTRRGGFRWVCWGGGHHDIAAGANATAGTEPEEEALTEDGFLQPNRGADCKWLWTKNGFHWVCYGGHHDIQVQSEDYVSHMRAAADSQHDQSSPPPYPPEPEAGDEFVTEDDLARAEKAADCKWLWTKGGFHWVCYGGGHRDWDAQGNEAGSELQPIKPPSQSAARECRWVWTRRHGFRWVCWGGGRRHRDVPQSAAQQAGDAVTDLHETDHGNPPPASECTWLWTKRGGFRWICYGGRR